MRPRTELVDVFSTFVQFSDDRFETWAADLRLVKSMNQLINKSIDHSNRRVKVDRLPIEEWCVSEKAPHSLSDISGWALYWHKLWCQGTHTYAQSHLAAYLQESCYWAALEVTERFVNIQYTLADGFQIAITRLESILKGYRPDYGSSLRAYAKIAFGNFLRDRMRQQKAIHICSDWGLLRKVSRTQLKEALLAAGYTQVASHLLVWQCFKAVCIPDPRRSVRSLPPPTEAQLVALAERYNRLRIQRCPSLSSIEVQTVSTVLDQLVQAARAYLHPTMTSLNQPQQDERGREILNELSVPDDDTPMAQLLAAEALTQQKARQQQIDAVLLDVIAALDLPQQELLRLYYNSHLTQKEIAAELDLKQYQVSRQLSRIRQRLLLSLANWSQQHLHISIDSAVLANVSGVIDEWLQKYYGDAC